ncbi:hypothetical protein [Leptospira mayottensis]|uniref:hypothetical protein n=1 Tax=Leptospira mayottensis TaxID=1137606 RepID=UPI000E35AD24|nr:hypothetical protein [Leptospira mayottensis]AXR68717.1 hypothetical protein DPV73_12600 [Leptospira mayottensis]
MTDPAEYIYEHEEKLGRACFIAEESNRIGIRDVRLAVSLDRVKLPENIESILFQEIESELGIELDEDNLYIRLNYSQFVEGLALPTDSVDSWRKFQGKLYHCLNCIGITLKSYQWLKIYGITLYRGIILEEKFEIYSYFFPLIKFFGRKVENRSENYVFDTTDSVISMGPIKESFESDFNVIEQPEIKYHPRTMLLEFYIANPSMIRSIFEREIAFQELTFEQAKKVFAIAGRRLACSLANLQLYKSVFQFLNSVENYRRREPELSSLDEELNNAVKLLYLGGDEMNSAFLEKDSIHDFDSFYEPLVELSTRIFENKSLSKAVIPALEKKNMLIEELSTKLKFDLFENF